MTFLLSFRTILHNNMLKMTCFLLDLSDNVLYFGCAFFFISDFKTSKTFSIVYEKRGKKEDFFLLFPPLYFKKFCAYDCRVFTPTYFFSKIADICCWSSFAFSPAT